MAKELGHAAILENIKPLNIHGSKLIDLVLSIPEPAHIKNARTGRYVFSNQSNLEIYSLNKIEDIIGRTVNELDGFMRPYWGNEFAKRINELDSNVSKNNKTITEKIEFLLQKQV